MRSRNGLFWQSLGLTLLVLLPMIGVVVFLGRQRDQQEELRRAAAGGSAAVEAGSQQIHRLLLAVQQEETAFLLLHIDAPAQQLTLCALPGDTLVDAPSGQTTLADCYLAAGPARAAKLLASTADAATPAYFAATAASFGTLVGAATASVDTAALLPVEARTELGYDKQTAVELTADDVEPFLQKLAPWQTGAMAARSRAAVWAAFLRQDSTLLEGLVAGARQISSRTLTSLRAQDLAEVEQTLSWLAGRSEVTVEYEVLPGTETAAGFDPGREGLARVAALLGPRA